MKNILLTLGTIFLLSFNASAQDLTPSAEKRVSLLTRVMSTELGLNESEYIKLKALNRERIVKSDEIAEMYSNDADMQSKKLNELETSFDKKFRAMLNPNQLAAYMTYKHGPNSELALSKEGSKTSNDQK